MQSKPKPPGETRDRWRLVVFLNPECQLSLDRIRAWLDATGPPGRRVSAAEAVRTALAVFAQTLEEGSME